MAPGQPRGKQDGFRVPQTIPGEKTASRPMSEKRSGRSGRESARSETDGKGTEELVTSAGSGTQEPQGQPGLPMDTGHLPWVLGLPSPLAKRHWGAGVQAPLEIRAEYPEHFLSGTHLFLLEMPALGQTRSQRRTGPPSHPHVPAVSQGHVLLEDRTEPAAGTAQGHVPRSHPGGTSVPSPGMTWGGTGRAVPATAAGRAGC